jgi:hypothetical protein
VNMHSCPTCGSARHLLCAEGYTVQMNVRVGVPAADELGPQDALVPLLSGCRDESLDIFLLHEEAVCGTERKACSAFGDALVKAAADGVRRLFIDMRGEMHCGAEVAAVLHCRLAALILCADLHQLQEVVLCVEAQDEQDVRVRSRALGPLCQHCPHIRS